MRVGYLTEKETNQLHALLDKACVLHSYYDKHHVDEDMSNKEWEAFVKKNNNAFSDGCLEVVMNDLEYLDVCDKEWSEELKIWRKKK